MTLGVSRSEMPPRPQPRLADPGPCASCSAAGSQRLRVHIPHGRWLGGALGPLQQLGAKNEKLGSKSPVGLEAGAAPLGPPDCLPLSRRRESAVCVTQILGTSRNALPGRGASHGAGPRVTSFSSVSVISS